ncbi:MAG: branched-chain amino acid ABC transporter permease [Burkholderiaceae bacterium]|nr:branched-chain amino acid ABC transporter permease [Burkholderiaceae bacterium]
MSHIKTYPGALVAVLITGLLLVAGLVFSQWQFLIAVALAKGLVALGVVLLLRSGLASFGQGLFYCVGAYTVGMSMTYLRWSDFLSLLALAIIVSAAIAWVLGFLLARYRDIFFAMLSLALSMILYGLLIRNPVLGGSDGFNVLSSKFLWGLFDDRLSRVGLFIATAVLCGLAVWLVQRYLKSGPGRLGPAIKDNEIRVEYLGTSARRNIHLSYVLAAALAGLGGGLSAFSIGHVDPDMAFWTTSGEFVFIAVLGGTRNAYAPFLGALVLELIRSLAYQYAPNMWQIVMGASMLALIVFLPGGLISIAQRYIERQRTGAVAHAPEGKL